MNVQEKADLLQAKVDAKFTPAQKERLEEAKDHLRDFVRSYGAYAALALPLIASESLVVCFGDTMQRVEDSFAALVPMDEEAPIHVAEMDRRFVKALEEVDPFNRNR